VQQDPLWGAREAAAVRRQPEVSQQERQEQQEALLQAQLVLPEEREVWMQVLPLRLEVSPQTVRLVNSQKAASLPGRLP